LERATLFFSKLSAILKIVKRLHLMGRLVRLYSIFGEIQKGLDNLGPDEVFQNRNGLAIELISGWLK